MYSLSKMGLTSLLKKREWESEGEREIKWEREKERNEGTKKIKTSCEAKRIHGSSTNTRVADT